MFTLLGNANAALREVQDAIDRDPDSQIRRAFIVAKIALVEAREMIHAEIDRKDRP